MTHVARTLQKGELNLKQRPTKSKKSHLHMAQVRLPPASCMSCRFRSAGALHQKLDCLEMIALPTVALFAFCDGEVWRYQE